MKRILVTGARGFIGKDLVKRLKKDPEYSVEAIMHKDVELTDPIAVDKFFEDYGSFHTIIHCAVKGGRRNQKDSAKIIYENIAMFENLVRHQDKFELMISVGSGAEYNTREDVRNASEAEVGFSIPPSYYGLSKYIINERIKELDKVINLRIFNVFGEDETDDRMIKHNVMQYIKKEPMHIHRDKFMSFFGIDDLYKVVDYVIQRHETLQYKDYNLTYGDKNTLYDICVLINTLSDYKVDIEVQTGFLDLSYSGSNNRLHSLNIKFDGLRKSVERVYNIWKKE